MLALRAANVPMTWSFQKIGETVLQGLAVIAIIWFLILWFQRIHDRKALLIRLAFTAVISVATYFVVTRLFAQLGYGMIAGLFLLVAIGWLLAFIWVPAVTGFIGRLFGSLYDGGDMEVEAKPFYSVFQTKKLKGKYFEALTEVRRQLDKFPTDFEGQILLAELQAENLNDLPGADVTIQRLCAQPGHSPQNFSFALNRLADWHLSITKDRETARQVLEKIMELMPDTEMSLRAAQKIARLADTDMLLAPHDRQTIEVKKGVRNLGLHRGEDGRLKAPEIDQEKVAAEYVAHLVQHPNDSHAREKLAVLYAAHYHRLDLAMDQLEQLIQQPNHATKQLAHWLNLMADLQVQEGADEDSVRATLQRIIDQFPGTGAAEIARRRLDHLKLAMKQQTKPRDIQLGTYEQNIGLKSAASPNAKRG